MQTKLFLLLIIFVSNLYNYVQSVMCYNCLKCTESSPGTVNFGCSICGTIVYSNYTMKVCASTCSAGSYEGGYLSCCSTDFCNYDTPSSSSFISCYECSTCSSSSPGSKTAGCAVCGSIAYSTYTQKRCLSSCSEGKYRRGNIHCCNTNYCNKDNPVHTISCYECSQCSSSPGYVSFGCNSCATIVYSTYTQKLCTSFCSPGTYQEGYLYCCNSNYCNYNTPLNIILVLFLFLILILIFWLFIKLIYCMLYNCLFNVHGENTYTKWIIRRFSMNL